LGKEYQNVEKKSFSNTETGVGNSSLEYNNNLSILQEIVC
jgi:hypothetical protein